MKWLLCLIDQYEKKQPKADKETYTIAGKFSKSDELH